MSADEEVQFVDAIVTQDVTLIHDYCNRGWTNTILGGTNYGCSALGLACMWHKFHASRALLCHNAHVTVGVLLESHWQRPWWQHVIDYIVSQLLRKDLRYIQETVPSDIAYIIFSYYWNYSSCKKWKTNKRKRIKRNK